MYNEPIAAIRRRTYTGDMDTLPKYDLNPDLESAPPVIGPRIMGRFNWIGFRTLAMKEIRRFSKIHTQTIAAPVVTTLLFYAVFSVAMGTGDGNAGRMIGNVPFFNFLAPGLIMMAMSQNAFANTSSSVMTAKVQGNIVDVLMTPLSPVELAVAIALGGIARGFMVGVATAIAMACFIHIRIFDFGAILTFGLLATMMMALVGIIGAIWADKFDHIAAVSNFIVTPLTFLSGTFYSVDRFPPTLRALSHLNPFFYMIDGFRFGFIGQADAPMWLGLTVLVGVNAALWAVTIRMLATGYKLKS
jgi:ABC-2 type transport system permease protein